MCEVVRLRTLGRVLLPAFPIAGQKPSGQGTPRNDADAAVDAQRNHLALFLAIDEVVVILHGDELRPAAPLRRIEQAFELPGEHARRADVLHFPGLHYVVKGLECLLDRCLGIAAMDLVEVDVFRAEPPQRGINGLHDVLARQTPLVGRRPHGIEDLRGDDDVLAP